MYGTLATGAYADRKRRKSAYIFEILTVSRKKSSFSQTNRENGCMAYSRRESDINIAAFENRRSAGFREFLLK